MTSHPQSFFPIETRDNETILAKAAQYAPYLDRLMRIFADDKDRIIKGQHDDILSEAQSAFCATLDQTRDEDAIMRAIRLYRGRINHLVAITDLLNLAPVTDHLKWLSDTAEIATSHLAQWLTYKEDQDNNWIILALGKLGARELNFSSDIDLIIITQNDPEDYEASTRYIKHTRRLTQLMSTPTMDGIGWRIDLRLRPDPGATPIAINQSAAISYYESMARTWERAAFIRARPIAGDIKAGLKFLEDLNPFIWRRYFDYTVLDDLKIMLRREKRPQDLLGYNIKNGEGGIRSIEFFVHAQQLIAGGRESQLRQNSTLNALDKLALNGWIQDQENQHLTHAYLDLRRIEHRIQMIGDAQTHHLPKSLETLTDFAHFCGYEDDTIFYQKMISLGDHVIANTASLLTDLVKQDAPDQLLSFDDDGIENQLSELGYQNTQTIINAVKGWIAGRIPSTRSQRSRELIIKLLPRLLQQCAQTENPDMSFASFTRLVESLPTGLQLFSLMDSHENVMAMIMDIIQSAPALADDISAFPILADALMYRSFWQPIDDWSEREEKLMQSVLDAKFYEDGLSLLRRHCREWKFQVSAQLLQGSIDGLQAGQHYSAIADIIIRVALPLVEKEITRRYGTVSDGGIAVIALGRCGAEEMTLTSDLDLIFIHDGHPDQTSSGPKQLSNQQYFSRYGQELINALSSLTPDGRCYEVDMRLRPSGNAGPVAVHIDGFEHYHQYDAWLWEHLALVKSRIIGGINHKTFSARIEAITQNYIKTVHQHATLVDKTTEMRQRLLASQPAKSFRDLRRIEGGIMDIDLWMAMMQLQPEASSLPIERQSIKTASILAQHNLITEAESKTLDDTIRNYSDIIQWIRLTKLTTEAIHDGPEGHEQPLPKAMAKQLNIQSLQDLDGLIEKTSKTILSIMKKYVSKPDKRE